jgi:hypothetical protein
MGPERRDVDDFESSPTGGLTKPRRLIDAGARASVPDNHCDRTVAGLSSEPFYFAKNGLADSRIPVIVRASVEDQEVSSRLKLQQRLVEYGSPISRPVRYRRVSEQFRGEWQNNAPPQTQIGGGRKGEKVGATSSRGDKRDGSMAHQRVIDAASSVANGR